MSSTTTHPFQPIFKLTPGVQSYDWGKIGSTSLAAQFGEQCIEGFVTDDKKPYAEVSWSVDREGVFGRESSGSWSSMFFALSSSMSLRRVSYFSASFEV